MKYDPIAIGDSIASHLKKADEAVAASREHFMAAGVLLLDVQENHPKHMEAICKRIGLGRTRRKELLMIAGGRKTLEQSRAENAERQRRFKDKKKKSRLPPPEPAEEPLPVPVTANEPSLGLSKRALAGFMIACRTWLPKMDDGDREMALRCCEELAAAEFGRAA
jgi:hypothetical protein